VLPLLTAKDVQVIRDLICNCSPRLYSDAVEALIFERFAHRPVTLDLGRFVILRTINANADAGNTAPFIIETSPPRDRRIHPATLHYALRWPEAQIVHVI
jgi:hypothetical protein